MKLGWLAWFAMVLGASAAHGQAPPRLNVEGLGRMPAFSHASVAGDLVFVSGTLGTRADSLELVEGGVAAQTEQILRNIERILAAAGVSLRDVLKVNVYLTDMSTFAEMNEAYIAVMASEALGGEPPARTTVGVRELPLGALVEMECVAKAPSALTDAPARSARADSDHDIVRTSGVLEREGETIYYESTGDGAEAIVLGHGLGGNHVVWYQQVPALARDYRVVTWSQRGFGRSTNHAGHADPVTAAADLAALLDHLDIDRAHVVGQSMGGWTALRFALDHPQRVRSLTLSASTGGIFTPPIEAGFDAFLKNAAAAAAEAGPPAIGRHPALREGFAEDDPARAFLYEQLGSLAPPAPAGIPTLLRQTRVDLAQLGQFDRPVLFIAGSEDGIFTPEMMREAAAQVPRGRVALLRGAGHSPYFEIPEQWNRALRTFLEGSGGE